MSSDELLDPAELDFVEVSAGSFRLGASCATIGGLSAIDPSSLEWIDSRLSPIRDVSLSQFEIARTTLDAEALIGELSDDAIDAIADLSDLCDLIDGILRPFELRLASED